MFKFNILTLFPDFFETVLSFGVLSQAIKKSLIDCHIIPIRSFAQAVDDRPFGGGDGMVMSYLPLAQALESIKNKGRIIYLSPQGNKWNQVKAKYFSQMKEVTLVCGRYAGVDSRWIHQYADEEISIGDYILSGGEPAALVLIDSISRYVDGVLGNPKSVKEESFEKNFLLEYPQWTRPKFIQGYKIPDVFFSGHHEKINQARYWLSLLRTKKRRPDLFENYFQKKDIVQAEKWMKTLSMDEKKACQLIDNGE